MNNFYCHQWITRCGKQPPFNGIHADSCFNESTQLFLLFLIIFTEVPTPQPPPRSPRRHSYPRALVFCGQLEGTCRSQCPTVTHNVPTQTLIPAGIGLLWPTLERAPERAATNIKRNINTFYY